MTGDETSPPDDGAADGPGRVGATLKAMRKAAGLTGYQLGARTGMSQAKVSRIETGAVLADAQDVAALVRALQAPADQVSRLVEQATRSQSQHNEWRLTEPVLVERQRELAEVEEATREFRVFQPAVIIGLLQTSEYARAILGGAQALSLPAGEPGAFGSVSEAVSAWVRRHEVLAEPHKKFYLLMTESVLAHRLSRSADMIAQIERLREVSAQDNVDLRIIPLGAKLALPPYHGFELLDERCVVVDLFNTPIFSQVRSEARFYRKVFDALSEAATSDIDGMLDRYLDLHIDLTQARPRSNGSGSA